MRKSDMKAVALIPARGGSKKVPGKNVRMLGGKPLIVHTIEAALKAELPARVLVSTDDPEIAELARRHGAEAPFLRPPEISLDSSTDLEVMRHLVGWLRDHEGYHFDLIAYLRPTTPFKTPAIIDGALRNMLERPELSGLKSVTPVSGISHPYWMFRKDGGRMLPFIEGVDIAKYHQRQLLPPCFRLNGVVDVLRVELVMGGGNQFGDRLGFHDVPEELAVDIDHELDFRLCEFLLKERENAL